MSFMPCGGFGMACFVDVPDFRPGTGVLSALGAVSR